MRFAVASATADNDFRYLNLLGAKSPSTTGHPHPLHSLEGSLHTPLDYGVNAIVRDSNTYNSDMPNP